jgi:hypothetical protein
MPIEFEGKKVRFRELTRMLARRKGVKNPQRLAGHIEKLHKRKKRRT